MAVPGRVLLNLCLLRVIASIILFAQASVGFQTHLAQSFCHLPSNIFSHYSHTGSSLSSFGHRRSTSLKISLAMSASSETRKNFVRIVSYNVLSSKLARPTHFTHTKPEYLEYEYRLPLILGKLEDEMNRNLDLDCSSSDDPLAGKNGTKALKDDPKSLEENAEKPKPPPTIFCLQEICHPFASALHVFFAQRGYHFITGLYGKRFNGYMGVGIAYPNEEFETIDVNICRLSDERDGGWPRPLDENELENRKHEMCSTDENKSTEKIEPKVDGKSGEVTTNGDFAEKYDISYRKETKPNVESEMNSETAHDKSKFQYFIRKIAESFEKFTAHSIEATCAYVRHHINKSMGIKFRTILGLPSFVDKRGEIELKDEVDPWEMSENRHNILLTAVLRHRQGHYSNGKGGKFSISNYHMPCAFYCPPVMNIHAEMVAKRVQDLAAKASKGGSLTENGTSDCENVSTIPYILAGDFNILPESPHYHLLTKGKMEDNDPTYPPPKHGEKWGIESKPMDSAYSLQNNDCSEPEFTNYAHIKEDENPFIGTLDYIFLSQANATERFDGAKRTGEWWKVHGVKKLPLTKDSGGPFPNQFEPSDHLLIAADLELESA